MSVSREQGLESMSEFRQNLYFSLLHTNASLPIAVISTDTTAHIMTDLMSMNDYHCSLVPKTQDSLNHVSLCESLGSARECCQ